MTPTTTTLELPCGCEVTVAHDTGDRGLTCECGQLWVIRAVRSNRIDYQVDKGQR